ncbi:MAG: methyltransferase domain-containing protein [Ectothiorhodospiraceae bacterium]|nr:methyltransferase domain-containing protein [Ectothiorhodospiraceae bacterium]
MTSKKNEAFSVKQSANKSSQQTSQPSVQQPLDPLSSKLLSSKPLSSKPASEKATTFEDHWQRRFRQFATNNEDDAGIAGWSSSGLETRLRYFKRLLGAVPDSGIWLDAGCGAGTYTRFLNQGHCTVIGVDYSFESVAKAKLRPGEGILWAVGDAKRLPYQESTFNGVLCFGVIQALSESESLVKSLTSVTRPGGQIWIDALNGWCLPNLWERLKRRLQGRPLHVRYESPGRLVNLMKKHGMVNVQRHWLPILPGRLQTFQWVLETPLVTLFLKLMVPLAALLSHSVVVVGKRAIDTGDKQ